MDQFSDNFWGEDITADCDDDGDILGGDLLVQMGIDAGAEELTGEGE